MNLSRLAKIDLNLLVALHILLEEGSVSKAASKLSDHTARHVKNTGATAGDV
jgi:hypothetical protein